MDCFSVKKILAEALYGHVLLATDRASGDLVAIKRTNIAAASTHTTLRSGQSVVPEDIETEKLVNHLIHADGHGHPNIVRMRAAFSQHGCDYMVFDYCADGDLLDTLTKGPVSLAVARKYFEQIVHGVSYLHGKGIAHRDLSLENILLNNGNCYVCDFGLATSASEPCVDTVGKQFYMAPEVVQGVVYVAAKADVWSLGVILFMLLTGMPLWQIASPTDANFAYFSKHGFRALLRMWNLHHLDIDAVDLLEHMLVRQPRKRIELKHVASHAFIQGRSRSTALKTTSADFKLVASAKNASKAKELVARFFKNKSFHHPM
ncbi:hypothetical protein AC1031_003099 [Aphanomyces cochlioides]|nr:hypothetical protein AC1031_003099 [Aphanomyces cochlioides]